MTLQRTTDTFGVTVEDGSFNATQAPGAVYVNPQAPKESWTKGLAGLVFDTGQRLLRESQANAKMQGTVDEFSGVTDAAKNSNIFTRSSYEEGVARQKVADTLASYQREAADDMAAFAANGGTPEDFIASNKKTLSARIAEVGQGLAGPDYLAAIGQADQMLNALGTAYTKYKMNYDKAQQEAVTSATLAQQNRNVLLAQSTPPIDPKTGMYDTSKHLGAYVDGLTGIIGTSAPLNGDMVDKALVAFTEQTARNSTVDGVAGITLMNQMYNATLQNPKLGGMSPEQQQKVLGALDGLRDRTAKEYVDDQVTQINRLSVAAAKGEPVNMDAVRRTVQDAEHLRHMNYITPTQSNRVVDAAIAVYKADLIRQGKQSMADQGVFTSEQAKKAFDEAQKVYGAKYGSAGLGRMLAIDEQMQLARVENNDFRREEVAKAMAAAVQQLHISGLSETPKVDGKGTELDPANVLTITVLRDAYKTRTTPGASQDWATYTNKLGSDSLSLQALLDTFSNGAGMTAQELTAAFVQNRKTAALLSQMPNASGNIYNEVDKVVLDVRSFGDRVGSVAWKWPSALMSVVSDTPQSERDKENRELAAGWRPLVQHAAAIRYAQNPNAYHGEGGAEVLAEQSQQDLSNRRFAVQGAAYGAVLMPGAEQALPGMVGVADDRGAVTTRTKGMVDHAVNEYKKAHKGDPEFLFVTMTAASGGYLLHGRLRGSEQNVRIGLIKPEDWNKFGKQREQEYLQALEGASMERKVPIAGGKEFLRLSGSNKNGWLPEAFVSAQVLAVGLRPPAGGQANTALLVNNTVNALGKGPVQRAVDTLGTPEMPSNLRSNYIALFAATAATAGVEHANALIESVKKVRASPETVDDVELERTLRTKFPKVSDDVWHKQYLPLLRAVIINEATALPH